MKITKYLKPSLISLKLETGDKRSVIESLLNVLVEKGGLPKERREEVLEALLERESLTSTGLGYGLALPHVRTNAIDKIQIVFGRSTQGMDFEALDGNPAHFFFLVLAPAKEIEEYLRVLSSISLLMKDENNRRSLLQAKTPEEIYKVLDKNM
jgi:mannitol/fructose-specific phosphotransferase system IIA component (Ntr-type)